VVYDSIDELGNQWSSKCMKRCSSEIKAGLVARIFGDTKNGIKCILVIY